MSVASPTGAMHDIYERPPRPARGVRATRSRSTTARPARSCAIGGPVRGARLTSAAPTSSPRCTAPLVQGYALDALEAEPIRRPAAGRPDAVPEPGPRRAVSAARRHRSRARPALPATGVGGAGLVAGDELVQLTAFPGSRRRPRRHPSSVPAAADGVNVRTPGRRWPLTKEESSMSRLSLLLVPALRRDRARRMRRLGVWRRHGGRDGHREDPRGRGAVQAAGAARRPLARRRGGSAATASR